MANMPAILYIAWTRWSLVDSRMVLSRSTDDGKTWSTPMEIDQKPGLPRDDNGALEGFDGAVGADSTVYAVWSAGNHLQFTTSRDGGKTFAKVKNIIRTGADNVCGAGFRSRQRISSNRGRRAQR